MKYHITINTNINIEAESGAEAIRELDARRETITKSSSIEEDLLLNSSVEDVELLEAEHEND